MADVRVRLTERRVGGAMPLVGFRLFFPAAALQAIVAMLLWIGWLAGELSIPSHLTALDWHRHELLVGFAGAVIAGFLLTAMPNWTGRAALAGQPLLALFVLWLAGRLSLAFSASLPLFFAVALDIAFPFVLVVLLATAITRGAGRRNLAVLAVVSAFALANIGFHVEILGGGSGAVGSRATLASLLLLVLVMGGRVVPAFTGNWLKGHGEKVLPAASRLLDTIAIALTVLALVLWTLSAAVGVVPRGLLAAVLGGAGIANFLRLARWRGYRTFAEPLVAVMHVAWLFGALGFLLLASSVMRPDLVRESIALHMWSVGCVSLMCLAIMTRASLGHAGHPLHADRAIMLLYIALVSSVLLRVAAGFGLGGLFGLELGALAWCLAWGGFVVRYRFLLVDTWREAPARID